MRDILRASFGYVSIYGTVNPSYVRFYFDTDYQISEHFVRSIRSN